MTTQRNDNSGNFANDRERAAEAGHKGGQASHRSDTDSDRAMHAGKSGTGNTGTGKGSSGNFANDPDRAAEAGRKGGENSHSGSRSGSKQ